jgi:hypothetical protein
MPSSANRCRNEARFRKDMLGFHENIETHHPMKSADATLLIPTGFCFSEEPIVRIDPHSAGLY